MRPPSPDRLKTVSTTTAPPRVCAIWYPATVTTGRRLGRSTCRSRTMASDTPFARAVRTTSERSTSRHTDRVIRATSAAWPAPPITMISIASADPTIGTMASGEWV